LIIHYRHRPNTGMHMVVVAALLAMLSPGARGNDQRVFIEQALDQPTSLTLKDTTLPRAVQQIANQTGIGVTLGPATLALLPYGEATQVDIDLRNSRLRDGLDELCRQIGMTYRVTDTGIEIIPAPPLARLGRPASWEELTTITRLLQTRWSGDDDDFKTIRKRVRFDGINGKADDLRERLEEQIERAGPGPAAGGARPGLRADGWRLDSLGGRDRGDEPAALLAPSVAAYGGSALLRSAAGGGAARGCRARREFPFAWIRHRLRYCPSGSKVTSRWWLKG
jgi:hypothetical protein